MFKALCLTQKRHRTRLRLFLTDFCHINITPNFYFKNSNLILIYHTYPVRHKVIKPADNGIKPVHDVIMFCLSTVC